MKLWFSYSLSVLMLGAFGCDSLTNAMKSALSAQTVKVWLEKATLKPQNGMNDSSPVTVHVVIIYDEDTLKKISALNSEDYFSSIQAMQNDDVAQDKLQVFVAEVIPGGPDITLRIKPRKVNNVGGFIFANYIPNQKMKNVTHRMSIGPEPACIIELGKGDFKVTPVIP